MRKVFLALLILIGIGSFASTTTVKADAANNTEGIKIDGHFDDWKDKPITNIQSNNDTYNIKHESLLADEDNVYFYLDMSPEHGYGYATIQPSGYKLTVGDKIFDITVQNPYNLTVNQPRKVDLYAYEEDGIGNVSKVLTSAKAYVNRIPINVDKGVGNGYTEKMEFKMPLRELGITGATPQKITMHNSDLGDQTLTVMGGSTGPILLAISGLALALLGLIKIPKISELRKSLHE